MPRTEFAVRINETNIHLAIDMGCGTGSDTLYMSKLGYQVFSFDINPDSVSICKQRFNNNPLVTISEASFENYDYPTCSVIIANSSLLFANPIEFVHTWERIEQCIVTGGIFAGDFMGINDSWAHGYRTTTSPMSISEVKNLFKNFDIVRFHERDELGENNDWQVKALAYFFSSSNET